MLKQSTSYSRRGFTGADFDFVACVLAPNEQRLHLEKLWGDPEAQREMLDLKEVLRGLLDSPSAIQVSPQLYFYVLVRHSFIQAGLGDADLADYVSSVITRSISANSADPLQDIAHGFTHTADFLSIISSSQGRMRYHLQVAAGNQFLVLTGLYPGFLKARCEKCGGPDLDFYESFAQQAFRGAAENHQVPGKSSRQLFGNLAEAMPTARRSLNRVAEEFVFLGE